jgi:fumarate hydratase class II
MTFVGLLRDLAVPSAIGLLDTQPGSSIMPGKVNPVIESVIQVAAHVIACDATITICGQAGNFELNVTMPIVTLKLLESIEFTANAINALTEKCVTGIEANEARCRELVEGSLVMVRALAPLTGYDAAAEIAHEAVATGKSVRQLAQLKKCCPKISSTALRTLSSMSMPGLEKQK